MDGHKTPFKNNKERQHGKVGRHMGPREMAGGAWLLAGLYLQGEERLLFCTSVPGFAAPCTAYRVGSDLTHCDSRFMTGRLTGHSL